MQPGALKRGALQRGAALQKAIAGCAKHEQKQIVKRGALNRGALATLDTGIPPHWIQLKGA